MSKVHLPPVCYLKILAAACVLIALIFRAEYRADASAITAPPKIRQLAETWFYRFQEGKIDRSELDERVNAQLTPEMIRDESATLRRLGRPTRFVYLGSQRVQDATGYNFAIVFPNASIVEAIALDPDGKIAGLDFQTISP